MSAPDAPPVVIDGGDRTCVALLIELRGHITRLAPGTVIHLIASDPAAPIDLASPRDDDDVAGRLAEQL
jgi:tRNA 2-thiouridine synthesizing protein A